MSNVKFNIYMDEDLKKEIKKRAIDDNTTSSAIISNLVKEYLQKGKSPKNSK